MVIVLKGRQTPTGIAATHVRPSAVVSLPSRTSQFHRNLGRSSDESMSDTEVLAASKLYSNTWQRQQRDGMEQNPVCRLSPFSYSDVKTERGAKNFLSHGDCTG